MTPNHIEDDVRSAVFVSMGCSLPSKSGGAAPCLLVARLRRIVLKLTGW
jgi:hypothetical protein